MEAKIDGFKEKLQVGAAAAKLLGHPARMSIIEFLNSQNACVTGDISAMLPLSRGTANQHLNMLKDAGWVKGEIQGSRICYCLDHDKIRLDTKHLQTFITNCTSQTNCMC